MHLSDEQFAELARYEDNFRIAVKAQGAKNPGPAALAKIHEIYTKASGDTQRLNTTCGHCIYVLLRDAGNFYYEEKARRERAVEEIEEVPNMGKVAVNGKPKKAKSKK